MKDIYSFLHNINNDLHEAFTVGLGLKVKKTLMH